MPKAADPRANFVIQSVKDQPKQICQGLTEVEHSHHHQP